MLPAPVFCGQDTIFLSHFCRFFYLKNLCGSILIITFHRQEWLFPKNCCFVQSLNVRMWKKHVAKTLMTHRGPLLWSLPLSWVRLTSCHQYDSFLNSLHTLLEIKHWQGCDTHLVSKKQTNKQRGAPLSVLFKVNQGWVPLLKKYRKW